MGVCANNDAHHALDNQNCAPHDGPDPSPRPAHVPCNIRVDVEEEGENPHQERKQHTQEASYPSSNRTNIPLFQGTNVGNRANILLFQEINPHVGNRANIPPFQGANPHDGNHSNNPPLSVRVDCGIPNGNSRITMLEEQLQQLLNNNKMKEHESDEEIEPFMPYILAFPYPLEFELLANYDQFKRHSIVSWVQLSDAFKKEFQVARTRKLECSSLANVRQFLGESLKAYINHFNIKATKTRGIDDSARLMALVAELTNANMVANPCSPKKSRSDGPYHPMYLTYTELTKTQEAIHVANEH
ncbi:hypothetical protein F8388_005087 [Cannabis sativa]|uniref:Retrotransposon gag domain-containing protein n=1 Tax=Cannabis sativa TaxID=3483 RepID=A0A7J6I3F9_CANSA|nr:hypothetical protein F8388_005087 [Cannabis sativa]KAF4402102.1 hypothetical protein G4B88_017614 [Cannabis sativa]